MEIPELYQLSIWVNQEITEGQIIQKFNSLQAVFQHNVTRPPDQPLKTFQEQQQELIDSLSSVKLTALSLSQLHMLDLVDIKQHIDKEGIKRINELLTNTDTVHISDELKAISNEIGEGLRIIKAIELALDPIVDDAEITPDPEKILARVIFDHEATVRDFKQLEEWSIRWFAIARGFSAALGLVPEDVEIVGASDGSHIIKILVWATLATAIAKATTASLESLVEYQEFRNKALEHRIMKDQHSQFTEKFEAMAKEYETMADKIKEDTIDTVTAKLEDDMKPKRGAKGELRSGVKHLVEFFSKGGDVDISIPDDMEETEEGEEGEEDQPTYDVAKINQTRQALRLEYTRINELRTESEKLQLEYDSSKTTMDHAEPQDENEEGD